MIGNHRRARGTPAAIRLHLTNVLGAGATRLLQSLLPALEKLDAVTISDIYLPAHGELANHRPMSVGTRTSHYRRWLPNALSRLLECVVLGHRFNGDSPLLVLGDLPIRCTGRQVVFAQTPHLVRPLRFGWRASSLKFVVSRAIFRFNLSRVSAFIVQTPMMRDKLLASYPALKVEVHVISQPAPAWLLAASAMPRRHEYSTGDKLKLIYPAAGYPHKNHQVLSRIAPVDAESWPVENLTLTIENEFNPAPNVRWIRCLGFLAEQSMIAAYGEADALLFLSREESYGFPLVEAMFLGLPIVCPDLPYAHSLCGDEAVYFHPVDVDSLKAAVWDLHHRLGAGWRPDWTRSLGSILSDWNAVAERMVDVVLEKDCG